MKVSSYNVALAGPAPTDWAISSSLDKGESQTGPEECDPQCQSQQVCLFWKIAGCELQSDIKSLVTQSLEGATPNKCQWLHIWPTTDAQLAAASCRVPKQAGASCWGEPQLWLGCDANGTPVLVSLVVGVADESPAQGTAVVTCCGSSVGPWSRSTVLLGILHLKVKMLLRTVTVCSFPLPKQTCRVFSCMSTSLKELGYDISWPGPYFPSGKAQGGGRMNNTPHFSWHLTSIPISTCKQTETEKQEGKELEISFSH